MSVESINRAGTIVAVGLLYTSTLLMISVPFVLFYAFFGIVGVIVGGIFWALFWLYIMIQVVRIRRRATERRPTIE